MHDDRKHEEGRPVQDGHGHSPGEDRDKLVLGYMLEHNREHVSELLGLAAKFEDAGQSGAAALIREAAKDFGSGNGKLGEALARL